jgi:hypothetical protein
MNTKQNNTNSLLSNNSVTVILVAFLSAIFLWQFGFLNYQEEENPIEDADQVMEILKINKDFDFNESNKAISTFNKKQDLNIAISETSFEVSNPDESKGGLVMNVSAISINE